jgi:molybdenum cofactor synthesis domain-containing protein
MPEIRVAILTVSDAGSRGEREDRSGPAVAAWAERRGWQITERAMVPDEAAAISAILRGWADGDLADLVITTGGTGLTRRDVTPEATRAVLERDAPGIPEAMRAAVLREFPRAALSRAVAGTRARTLIINLPGSPGGVRDGLAVLDDIVEHAVELLRGDRTEHG